MQADVVVGNVYDLVQHFHVLGDLVFGFFADEGECSVDADQEYPHHPRIDVTLRRTADNQSLIQQTNMFFHLYHKAFVFCLCF